MFFVASKAINVIYGPFHYAGIRASIIVVTDQVKPG
jgi:hypothetical protein